jgi:hypothetical protein
MKEAKWIHNMKEALNSIVDSNWDWLSKQLILVLNSNSTKGDVEMCSRIVIRFNMIMFFLSRDITNAPINKSIQNKPS